MPRSWLPDLLSRCGYRLGAEIGVQGGVYAAQILESWPGDMILVDCWRHYEDGIYVDLANVPDAEQEAYYSLCLRNMQPFGDRIRILRMFSHEAAPLIADESLDWVYIDANHAYRYVRQDLALWFPKIRPGGLMAGHDYTQDNDDPAAGCFGVKAAVDEFAEGRADVLYVSREDWPTWYFWKKSK